MKTKYLISIIFIISLLLIGCGSEQTKKLDDSTATDESIALIVQANNQFAFDLYSKFSEDEKGNIFFSPYSISTALSMTYEGARGQTAEEMQSVMHFPEDANIRKPGSAAVYNIINKKDKDYKLYTANALWAQTGYTFLPEYMETINNYYGGRATELDFARDTEASRKIINTWVEDQTNDKIKDLIPAGVLKPATRLVLTNAIYFKGDWVKQFEKKNTREENFKVNPEETTKVQMMSLTGEKANFNYYQDEKLQALELPYEGEEVSMLVILPKKDIKSIEDMITVENFANLRSNMRKQNINVYLPKFKFETKYFMAQTLKDMGMPTAFSDGADFSGMDGSNSLKIGNVIHQAFVDVNEEGTEAAAATAVIMVEKAAAMSTIFRADHPFLFVIQEKSTGNILFLGRVTNPESA